MTVLPRVTWPSPPMAMAPARRTARIVVPCGSNFKLSLIVGRVSLSCVLEGGYGRKCGRGVGSQGGYRSGSWRCPRDPEVPARLEVLHWIQEDAKRRNAGRGAGARALP